MRERGTLVLSVALLSGLAVGSYWLAEQARLSDAAPKTRGHDIDYTASDITLTRMDAKGRAQYVIDAKQLVHYADDDSGELTAPRLAGAKADRPGMRVRADLGKTTSEGEEVRLYGNVVLTRAPWKGAPELIARGPYMLALPEQEILRTDQAVAVTQGGSRVTAHGMQYDNGVRKLQLDGGASGRVHAVIEPRNTRAAHSNATTSVSPPSSSSAPSSHPAPTR